MNRAILAGRLGRDPEGRETRAGSVVTMSIATNERRKEGDQWVDAVEWHRVVCFGRTAENVEKYLAKGSQCIVEGRIKTSTWEKDGETKYRTEIVAERVEFVGSSSGERPSGGGYSSSSRSSGGSSSAGSDDEIPF